MRHPLERRAAAAQATLDRFRDKPFEVGKNDCAQMTKYHLRQIGRPVKLATVGSYTNWLGAKRALKRLGFETLAEMADAHFPRIAPAACLVGDLIELEPEPGSPDFGCFVVALGNGRVIGWAEGAEGATVLQPSAYKAAWRVL